MYRFTCIDLVVFAGFAVVLVSGARAEDVALASLRLRGGYDANPTLSAQGRGTGLIGADLAFAVGTENDDVKAGIVGEASVTRYADPAVLPSRHEKLKLELANKEQGGLSLRSTTSLEQTERYDLRAFDARQSVRMQWVGGPVRPFVTAEFSYSRLNETNAIFPAFLPVDQVFVRGTLIPGIAVKAEKLEVGSSVNLSATRYTDEFDVFGYRRDNERIQPFLFLRYADGGFNLFATVSELYGQWRDVDFSRVERTLFEVTGSYATGPWTLELSAKRVAGETTFPVSPITIITAFAASLKWNVDAKTTLSLAARNLTTDYLDSPFRARTRALTLGATRAIAQNLSLGLDASLIKARDLAGRNIDGFAVVASLTRKFDLKALAGGATSALDRKP
jgi:hypothetical protein